MDNQKDLIDSDCGCMIREGVILMAEVSIHIESDGGAHAILDFGDWEKELFFENCTDLNDAEQLCENWIMEQDE